ncbi:MAG: nitrophenyl compound nitroreductase subunit ArsF family protein [Pirellulaceae bacterium]
MTLKEALTNSLLMFVAATCVVLIVKALPQAQPTTSALAGSDRGSNDAVAPRPNTGTPTIAVQDGIQVSYLHGNVRCVTCRSIESNAKQAVETGFADQLASGQIQWAAINYESPGNEHYITDYEVVAPTVVLAKYVDGRQVAWKALPEVWEHVGDDAALVNFVQRSLREFLGDSATGPSAVSDSMRSSSEPEPSTLPIPE